MALYAILVLYPAVSFSPNRVSLELFYLSKAAGYFILFCFGFFPYLATIKNTCLISVYTFMFVSFFFASIYFVATYEVASIKKNIGSRVDVVLTTKAGTTIQTSDSVIYIGKTNNYIFLHFYDKNGDNSNTKVINLAEITEMKIKKNVGWYRPLP